MSDDGQIVQLVDDYKSYGTWAGGESPELLCPTCQAIICLVGTQVRAQAERYHVVSGSPAHLKHGFSVTCPGCGVLVAMRTMDMQERMTATGEIRKLKRERDEMEARVVEARDKEQGLAQWQARLEKMESELDPVRDLKAENRRLQQELVVALNEAVKLRTLAERRYAELSELRGATT